MFFLPSGKDLAAHILIRTPSENSTVRITANLTAKVSAFIIGERSEFFQGVFLYFAGTVISTYEYMLQPVVAP